MNQKLRQAGLFVILAVFTVSLTTSFVGVADASPQSRGEIKSQPVEPSVKQKNYDKAVPETKPQATRSESDPTRPAGGPVEPSERAKHSAELAEKFKVDASPSLVKVSVSDPNTRSHKDHIVTGELRTFTAVFAVVNHADIDLQNVKILVTSDTESVEGEIIGNYDQVHRNISVVIDAVDPASVDAEIVNYEVI